MWRLRDGAVVGELQRECALCGVEVVSGRVRVELVGPRFCADVAWQLTWLRDTAGRWLAPVSHHVERI